MKPLKEIAEWNKNMSWHLIIERKGIPPLDFTTPFAGKSRFGQLTGFPLDSLSLKWENHAFYISKEDRQRISDYLLEKYGENKEYLLDLLKKGEARCDEMRVISDKLDANSLQSIKNYFDAQERTAVFFRIVLPLEDFLLEILNKEFTKPFKDNSMMHFQKAIADVARQIKENPALLQAFKDGVVLEKIKEIHEKYSWLGIFHYTGDYMRIEAVLDKIKEELKKEDKKDEYVFEPEKDFEIYRRCVFLRTHLAESFMYSNARIKPVLEQKAIDWKVTYKHLIHMSHYEILDSMRKNALILSKDKIEQRMKNFAMYLYKGNVYLLGNDELGLRKIEEESKVLKGVVANKGKAVGKARIILNHEDFSKVEGGDILIAPSTTPNYISIMHKAAAFITDEGGITSHAAIISREMGKPCIVGMKDATKVLQDDDLLEVDAYEGVIRVLDDRNI